MWPPRREAPDRTSTPTSLIFDDINGRWIAVTLDTERCGGEDIEEWHWIYLLPRPDGSMAGEWIDDSVKCYSKRSVTFTRTGDAQRPAPDPAGLPARVASPALGLRGFYRSRVTAANGQPKLGDQDFSVDTFCLRAGDRCLSRFVLFDFSDHQLFIFANNAWTENSEEDVPCPAGGTSHVRMTGVFPYQSQSRIRLPRFPATAWRMLPVVSAKVAPTIRCSPA